MGLFHYGDLIINIALDSDFPWIDSFLCVIIRIPLLVVEKDYNNVWYGMGQGRKIGFSEETGLF